MDNKQAVEFCGRWLKLWTGNQPEALISFYADTAYYQDPAHPDGLKGKDLIFSYFKKLLAKYPEWIWEAEEIFSHPKGFTLKWKARLSPERKPFFGLDIVEVKDGHIVRNEVYFDPSPMRP